MRLARPALLLATLAAAAAGGGLFLGGRGAPPVRVMPPVAAPATQPPATAPVVQPRRPAPAPRAASEPLSARVDRLVRSGDPVAAFAAYKRVTDCLWARDHADWLAAHVAPADRALLPTAQAACGDLASDQVQSRLRWLEAAAAAGVHHAPTALAHEGPDGLGLVADQDREGPQYADWRQRVEAAYDAGVRTCDPESLEYRVNAFETGLGVPPDRARALTYWIAWVDCRQRFEGGPDRGLTGSDGVARRLGASLRPDEIAAAVAAGHQLARDARPLAGDR